MIFLKLLVLSDLYSGASMVWWCYPWWAIVRQMTLCSHYCSKDFNLLVEELILIFSISYLNSMRRQRNVFLHILNLMELWNMTTYKALNSCLVSVEFKTSGSICIWSCDRRIQLLKIVWSDFHLRLLQRLLQLLQQRTTWWLGEGILLVCVCTDWWHRLIVCFFVFFTNQFMGCNDWKFFVIHL